jgi:uncharacterized protein YdaU (DUF1376 family)
MNYYQRHLGDYMRDTRHLSILEHGVYTLLLDWYYIHERGIPEGMEFRLTSARTKAEREAVNNVLAEFFSLEDGTWINRRAEEEISRAVALRENGKKGGRPTKYEPEAQIFQPSKAAAVCVAIRSEGVSDGNPQHPKLLALIAAGAEIGEFVNAARLAREKEKGFAYLLAVVKGRRRDAEKIVANARASPSLPRRKTVSEERAETYAGLTLVTHLRRSASRSTRDSVWETHGTARKDTT